jgi:hydroxymethylglutaryl-CoA lyase
MQKTLKIIECPRDAMQGLTTFIPTDQKINYINQLLKVGFDVLDCGSFVSSKAIPQMQDTKTVLNSISWRESQTQLLTIVANQRGAEEACQIEQVAYLGYPFSISETFQLRNTNATIANSLIRLQDIQTLCQQAQKQLVVYISMGFGNPYGDEWNVEIVQYWVDKLADMGIKIISLSDTVGVAKAETVAYLFKNLIPPYPDVEFGAHLHSRPDDWRDKLAAAVDNGCLRFDGAIKGFGGCPMAKDDLTGNMPTEKMWDYLQRQNLAPRINAQELEKSIQMAGLVFPVAEVTA